MLYSLNCKVIAFSSAEESLKYLRDNTKGVSLILSDIDLPGMSGIDFLRIVRKKFQEIPIILQSGGSAMTRARSVLLGAVAYLEKPYGRVELQGVLKELQFNMRSGVMS